MSRRSRKAGSCISLAVTLAQTAVYPYNGFDEIARAKNNHIREVAQTIKCCQQLVGCLPSSAVELVLRSVYCAHPESVVAFHPVS